MPQSSTSSVSKGARPYGDRVYGSAFLVGDLDAQAFIRLIDQEIAIELLDAWGRFDGLAQLGFDLP